MKIMVNKEQLKNIILSAEPALTREIVNRYTDSELKEWAKLLKVKC